MWTLLLSLSHSTIERNCLLHVEVELRQVCWWNVPSKQTSLLKWTQIFHKHHTLCEEPDWHNSELQIKWNGDFPASDVACLAAAHLTGGRYPPGTGGHTPPARARTLQNPAPPHPIRSRSPRHHTTPPTRTAAMQMQSLTLRAAPASRRPELPASSAHLGAALCFLRLPCSIRRRRPRSIRASASLDQEVKEVAASPSPSGKRTSAPCSLVTTDGRWWLVQD
jgi:hypothetical protein